MKNESWSDQPGGHDVAPARGPDWSPAPGVREDGHDEPRSWERDGSRRLRVPGLDPVAIECCETIQTKLWLSYPPGSAKKVTVFVGATPRCGVSTVAANFAGALARAPGSRVLLIAFDTPAPRQLPLQHTPDLSAWLDDRCGPPDSLDTPPNLYRLSSETLGPVVAQVLQSEAFDEFLARARERFDHIVVDAPPLQAHPETLVLCRKSDAVVLVVRAGKTRVQTAAWACEQIDRARCYLAGVVLNRRRYYIPGWLYRML